MSRSRTHTKPTYHAKDAMHITPGTIIAENFKVVAKIGEGGMGTVFLAEDLAQNKQVAIKIVSQNLNRTALGRFRRETQALVKLNHSNIAHVYHWGFYDETIPFLVMELFDGISLTSYLRLYGALTEADALLVFKEITAALDYAHFMGVVHRDIKPANIILTLSKTKRPTSAKLVDFGLAHFQDSDGQALTKAGEPIGSPPYMSPEQWRGDQLDARSDIYSLGCLIYEALTGKQPYQAESPFGLFMQHERAPLPCLKKTGALVRTYEAWDKLIAGMLAKDPSDRYQQTAEIKAELSRLENGDTLRGPLSTSGREALVFPIKKAAMVMAILAILCTMSISWLLKDQNLSKVEVGAAQAAPILPSVSVCKSQAYCMWRFPRSESLGTIWAYPSRTKYEAKGDVQIPRTAMSIAPSDHLIANPYLLSDEQCSAFGALEFDGRAADITDEQFKAFTRFRSLGSLNLNTTSITVASMPVLNSFDQLTKLSVEGSDLIGADLKKFMGLPKLLSLDVSHLTGVDELLPSLPACRLQNLYLRGDGLTDFDLTTIARCRHLQVLHIGRNTNLTGEGMAKLAALKNLEELEMEYIPLDSSKLAALHKLKHLRYFLTTRDLHDAATLKRLREVLPPDCQIQFVRDVSKDLSM